ncbi:MAG: FkbM family methyltransferase [Nanoarchaeota archaeon]|nr:FkbM family methyltransferase [Nanoarchaeota archaeon]
MNSLRNFLFNILDKPGSWFTTKGYLKYYKLKEGDVIIDCGAYLGYFTVFAAKKVGKKGKVIAFEPETKNYNFLKKIIDSEKLENVIVIKKALYNEKKELCFKSRFMFSSISNKKNVSKGKKIISTTLDYELERLGIKKVDFIKMDIEGAELEALEGAKNTLKNTSHLAIACYHIRNGKITGKTLKPLLDDIGFKTKIGFISHLTLYASKIQKP